MFRPPDQPVKISVTFTWDIPEAERLYRAWSYYYPDVELGGPALNSPAVEFVPGRFLKKGVTITSRGCVRNCPWCFVPQREGRIMEFSSNDIPIHAGHIVQDNNLLACSRDHINLVFAMLRKQKKGITFSGGLDARLLEPWHIELIDSISVRELWFACDSNRSLTDLERIVPMLAHIPERKKRCFVMIGYGKEDISQAENRLKKVYALGFLPFSQLYRGEGEREYTRNWQSLNKKWSRPAAYRPAHQSGSGSQTSMYLTESNEVQL